MGRRFEKGLTLVELLVALAISTIVLGLAATVMINSMNSYKKIASQQLLQQEANLLLTQLRTIHQQHHSYTISFDKNQNFYVITYPNGTIDMLGSRNINFEIEINNMKISEDQIFSVTPDTDQLNISIKASTQNGGTSFEIETGIIRV